MKITKKNLVETLYIKELSFKGAKLQA